MRRAIPSLLLPLLAALALALPAPGHAIPATGTKGVVASAHEEASRAGVELLRAGGNAIDAAVGAAFVLAVVEPFSSGIGGGGFALVKRGESLEFLDFREVAPKAATPDMYVRDGKPDPELSRDGILSVAVPGAVAGYLELHASGGKLPRAKVLEPAIRLAERGFPLDARFRGALSWRLGLLRKDPEASRLFLVPGAKGAPAELPPLGHSIVQKELAATLRAIAKDGAKAFYGGAVAKQLVADMRARGGLVTAEDLSGYRVRRREPLVGSYRGHAIATAPLPSAGGQVVLTVLNVLETEPALSWRDPSSLHLYVEASKRAFADRALLGDPAFVTDPIPALVTKERAKKLRARIGPRATPADAIRPGEDAPLSRVPGPIPADDSPDTTHLSVIDARGDAVVLTSTVNYVFGSGVVAKGTGVLWNDEMDDFAAAAGASNAYELVGASPNLPGPGKIPLSSMSPTLLFDGPSTKGAVRLAVGSPGGPRIPTTVIQAILAFVDHGADVQTALSLGRLHHQHKPDRISAEPFALEPATRAALEARGHVISPEEPWSNAAAVAFDPRTGLRTGASDPRGVGRALAE